MAFTTAERVDIRRFAGYSMYGASTASLTGYRFFTHYGTLEYRVTNMMPEEEAVVRTTYLAPLALLEAAIPAAAANLDTDSAAVWKRNRNEVADRTALYAQIRRGLCSFIGVPPGEGLGSPGISFVV